MCPNNVRHQTYRMFEVLTTWVQRCLLMFHRWIYWNINIKKLTSCFYYRFTAIYKHNFLTLCVKEQSLVMDDTVSLFHYADCTLRNVFVQSVSFDLLLFNVITNFTLAKSKTKFLYKRTGEDKSTVKIRLFRRSFVLHSSIHVYLTKS